MQLNQRYIRQMILPGFGLATQEKLAHAKVLIVGMGGLGCPVLQYLVGVGVGTIGIMDSDIISVSNLHRQLLYEEQHIGLVKVAVAANKMRLQNSTIQINEYPFAINKRNALEIIEQYDIVIDATDNFSAKYLINDASVILNKPWIYGAVSGFEGQVCVFNLSNNAEAPIHYRHLFPEQPANNEIASCEEAGVMGVLPGIIGIMQAGEAIKLITGLGLTKNQKLLNYNFLNASWYEIDIHTKVNSPKIDLDFFHATNYEFDCELSEAEIEEVDIEEIDVQQFLDFKKDAQIYILDVRELHEYPSIDFADAQIPMSALKQSIRQLPNQPICVICHQGIRSVYAAQLIKLQKQLEVYSLRGGLTAYFNKISHE